METIDNIPITKIQRATKILKTGAKVGVNYAKYYSSKIVGQDQSKEDLDRNNAEDIYDGLKNLKGGALKVAQMLSMDQSILPESYVETFSLSQFSVPPLSKALVAKTFRKYFGCSPEEVFDSFNPESIFAASIGQVHHAIKDGKELAVKIQYPGVADSITSDLALVKPVAMRMFNIKGEGSERYFEEVRDKLLDETNYILEVEQSKEISDSCKHLPNLLFPKYYEELSTDRIITMDWMKGDHLSDFAAKNNDPDISNLIGQTLWDFYMYQIHQLKVVHADPHPGNFLVTDDNRLVVLDFGCIKRIPDDFYNPYFSLSEPKLLNDKKLFTQKLFELEILRDFDSDDEIEFFTSMFHQLLSLFNRPFQSDYFDFSDKSYFDELASLGEQYARNNELRKYNGNRGSRHFIYMNRTFFGLYNLLFKLKAGKIKIHV